MSASSMQKIQYTPGLMAVLPLFYVGWADGILSPGESQKIRDKLNNLKFLTAEEKAIALNWSEPTNPPRDETYQEWQKIILKHCKDSNEDEKNSLINLGLLLAKNCDDCKDPTYWASDQTKNALQELQQIMGVNNVEINQHLSKQETVAPVADFDIDKMTKNDSYKFIENNGSTTIQANHVFESETYLGKCMFAIMKSIFIKRDKKHLDQFKQYVEQQ